MRLLFLCGSLEPGRDGVGDYTRRLAQECAKLGHTCALIALNDGHVAAPAEVVEPGGLATLRLPPGTEIATAVAFRERFAPDWISLQLVSYALHPKGLLFAAIPRLHALIARIPLHLMLHELWLGNDAVPRLRHRVIGWMQKSSLRRLLATLRPALVSTTNPVYAALLKTIGVDAGILPQFGNIPVAPAGQPLPDEIASQLQPSFDWTGLFFGGLYREWQPEPFLSRLARAARTAGRSVGLVQIGNPGGEGNAIWSQLERDYAATFNFVRLGPQPGPVVSAVMQLADFGIAASPWSVIGKSGAAAAMLDHGLPVIVTRDDFQPRVVAPVPPTTDPLVHRDSDELEAKLAAGLPKRAPHPRAPEIAAMWTKQLATQTEPRP
jgi:hypothetical protein